MKSRVLAVLAVFMMALSVPMSGFASYVDISREFQVDREKGTVYFAIKNRTSARIDSLHGFVYGFDVDGKSPPALANNPHRPALKITPGDHLPGKWAVYRFDIYPRMKDYRYYGVTIYDRALAFNPFDLN